MLSRESNPSTLATIASPISRVCVHNECLPYILNLRRHGTLLGSRNEKTGESLVKLKLDRVLRVDLSANSCLFLPFLFLILFLSFGGVFFLSFVFIILYMTYLLHRCLSATLQQWHEELNKQND